ncbi:uncharacterized protein LOC130972883 [Arachis stenosperma]|uniref:uncharacterized protein LOC130972883 n=1 Tax=Arachis stenosperma TaxID=217475 RepID=UPI0025ACE6A7|nr:uncharacterized protein LOC130972883 [Arachis stenosperma]
MDFLEYNKRLFYLSVYSFQKDAMESSVEIVIEKLLNITKDRVSKVWNACKPSVDDTEQPNHEIDVLSGHENDVNYVQFRLNHDNIVICSRDGSAIIWIPKSRRSHVKFIK